MLAYRILLSLVAPVVLLRLISRWIRDVETGGDLNERLGRAGDPANGAWLWIHGASNGELASARLLIETLRDRSPDLQILATTNTTSGRALVQSWGLARVAARLAPLDHRLSLARFLARGRPAMMIVIENELWPNRLVACHARNVPVAVVGARISQRSAAIWNRFGRLRRATFGSVSWISPQDSASRDRFAALGVPTSCLGTVLNLKSIAELARPDMAEIERFAAFGERGLTLFAASTHEGEEEIILGAFAAARRQLPSLRLILAPRHPRRSDAIGALIDAAGLRYARRSLGGYPDADTFVYLADTLGEMALWYRLAGMTFVGGSLVEKGGHTPFEPVRARSVVLHGPHTANFRSTYEELAEAGAARLVKNADEMTAAVLDLADPDRQDQISKAAQAVVSNDMNRAEMDALVARIFDLAPALRRDTAP